MTDEPDRFDALFFANASRLVRLAALLGDDDPDITGRTRSVVLWVIYDADRRVRAVTMRLRDGTTLPARRLSGPGWRGRAYFALGRTGEVTSVQVHHRGGTTTTYPAEQITDPSIR